MAVWINFNRIRVATLLVAGFACLGSVCAVGQGAQKSTVDQDGQQVAQKSAPAHETWQKEFDHVCSNTQEAMNFSEDELAKLVQRCDALLPQIEKLDETRKKVYMGRLRMCRGLYAYVLESKRNEKK
jgi:hypothetical protein